MYSYSNAIQREKHKKRETKGDWRDRVSEERQTPKSTGVIQNCRTIQLVRTTLTLEDVNGKKIEAEGESGRDRFIPQKFDRVREVFGTFKDGDVYNRYTVDNGGFRADLKDRIVFLKGEKPSKSDNIIFYKDKKNGNRSRYHCAEPNALVNVLSAIEERGVHKDFQIFTGKFTVPEGIKTPCGVCQQWVRGRGNEFRMKDIVKKAINDDLKRMYSEEKKTPSAS